MEINLPSITLQLEEWQLIAGGILLYLVASILSARLGVYAERNDKPETKGVFPVFIFFFWPIAFVLFIIFLLCTAGIKPDKSDSSNGNECPEQKG